MIRGFFIIFVFFQAVYLLRVYLYSITLHLLTGLFLSPFILRCIVNHLVSSIFVIGSLNGRMALLLFHGTFIIIYTPALRLLNYHDGSCP